MCKGTDNPRASPPRAIAIASYPKATSRSPLAPAPSGLAKMPAFEPSRPPASLSPGWALRQPFGASLIHGHGKLCQDASCPDLVPVVGIGWVQIYAGIGNTQLRDGSLPSGRRY